MGGAQGNYGHLAQSANPQVADANQNKNNLGFPNGRRIMGGGAGQVGQPGGAQVKPGMPMNKPGMPMQQGPGSNPYQVSQEDRDMMMRGRDQQVGSQGTPRAIQMDAMLGPNGQYIGRDNNNQFPGMDRQSINMPEMRGQAFGPNGQLMGRMPQPMPGPGYPGRGGMQERPFQVGSSGPQRLQGQGGK